jgi:hypothetical protein
VKHILAPMSESEQELVLQHMMSLWERHAVSCAAEDERFLEQFLIAVFDNSLGGLGDQQVDLERRIAAGSKNLFKYWPLFRIYACANASKLSGDELLRMCINVSALVHSANREKSRVSRPLRQSLCTLGRLRERGFTQEDLDEVLKRLPKVAQKVLFARGNPTRKLSSFSEKAAAAHALRVSRQHIAGSPLQRLLLDFAENVLTADCPMAAAEIYKGLPTMAKLAILVEEACRPLVPPLFTFEADIDGFEEKIKVLLSGRKNLKGRDASHDLDELALEVIRQHCELQGVERPSWTNDARGLPGGATHEFLLAVGKELKLNLVTEQSARRLRSATKRMSQVVRPYFIRLGFED